MKIWQADRTLLNIMVLNEKGKPEWYWLTVNLAERLPAILLYFKPLLLSFLINSNSRARLINILLYAYYLNNFYYIDSRDQKSEVTPKS